MWTVTIYGQKPFDMETSPITEHRGELYDAANLMIEGIEWFLRHACDSIIECGKE